MPQRGQHHLSHAGRDLIPRSISLGEAELGEYEQGVGEQGEGRKLFGGSKRPTVRPRLRSRRALAEALAGST